MVSQRHHSSANRGRGRTGTLAVTVDVRNVANGCIQCIDRHRIGQHAVAAVHRLQRIGNRARTRKRMSVPLQRNRIGANRRVKGLRIVHIDVHLLRDG